MATILNDNPAWSNILTGLLGAYTGVEQGKANKAAQQRQQQLDAQSAAIANAQVKLYGSEADRNTEQAQVDKANIGKDAAYNRAHGLDPSGTPIKVNTSGIQLQPGNKGKKAPVTLQERFDAAKQAYGRGASMGITGPANPYFQPMQDTYNLLMRQEQEQSAAQLAGLRFGYEKQLKDVPTYANLHHVGRGGGGSGGGSSEDYDAIDAALGKGVTTARQAAERGSQLEATAIRHGIKPNSPIIHYIRDRTNAKIQGFGGMSGGSGGVGMPP